MVSPVFVKGIFATTFDYVRVALRITFIIRSLSKRNISIACFSLRQGNFVPLKLLSCGTQTTLYFIGVCQKRNLDCVFHQSLS